MSDIMFLRFSVSPKTYLESTVNTKIPIQNPKNLTGHDLPSNTHIPILTPTIHKYPIGRENNTAIHMCLDIHSHLNCANVWNHANT